MVEFIDGPDSLLTSHNLDPEDSSEQISKPANLNQAET